MPSHAFELTTFSKPTYCDACQGLLWGLVKQGCRCIDCGTIAHKDCQKRLNVCEAMTQPQPVSGKGLDSPATKSLRSLQERDSLSKLKTEEIQNILVSAAIHAQDSTQPTNEYLANLPPLNPQNTAKNFSRFVSRCGPMFSFRDNLLLLLSWDKPTDTLAALLVYCLLCLYPKLCLLLPHILFIHLLITAYNKRYPQSTPEPNSRYFFTPAFEETSPEYLRNMQNLQNMMGEMSDLYDLVASHAHRVDWSSENNTMRLFQITLFSFVLLALTVWCIPLNLLALLAGVSLFLLNTRFTKYVLKELMPQLADLGQHQLQGLSDWYLRLEQRLNDQGQRRELSLYENQRWWPGSGFMPHLLPDERGLWTDYSGTVEYGPKEEFAAPEGYRWVQDNWRLDETGPWVDDTLDLEVIVNLDNGGWVYTDTHWENPSIDKAGEQDVTRRRRWVRQCERCLKEQKRK